MVSLDQDLGIGALEILFPMFQCLDNRQELPIVRVIVLFGRRAYSRLQIAWAKNPESNILVKDAGVCEAACIGL